LEQFEAAPHHQRVLELARNKLQRHGNAIAQQAGDAIPLVLAFSLELAGEHFEQHQRVVVEQSRQDIAPDRV